MESRPTQQVVAANAPSMAKLVKGMAMLPKMLSAI